VLTLVAEHDIDHHDIADMDVAVCQTAYDIAGGGQFGAKDVRPGGLSGHGRSTSLLSCCFVVEVALRHRVSTS
jgi:hypothetical protein